MNPTLATASLVLPFTSAADLSAKKGYFVKKGSADGIVALCSGATDASIGVIVTGEAVGGHNAVALPGVPGLVKVMLNTTPGSVVQFSKLQLCSDGTVAIDAGTGARRLVAEALEAGVAGEWIKARLIEPVVYAS